MSRLSQDPANLLPIVVTPGAGVSARRVQSVNTTGDRPATDERELGNEAIVGTTFDTPQVTLAIEANLVNAHLLNQVANRPSGSTYTDASLLTMLGNQDVDLLMRQRDTARTSFVQDVYVKQGQIGSYRIAAATNASATETYNLTATNKTAFERFVQHDHLTTVSSSQTALTLSATPVPLTKGIASGNNLISLAYATSSGTSTYLLEGTDYSVTGTAVTISSSAAPAASGTQIMAVYQRSGSTPGTALDDFAAKDASSPAAIRGYSFIPVTITVSGTSLLTRGVQSVEATVDFQLQTEVGMGNQTIAASRQTPAAVTGNFTILEDNWALEKLLQTGATSPTNTDFPIDGYRDDIVIKLDFKNPATGSITRTDVLSGCVITNDGKQVQVGQAVGKNYAFKGSTGFDWLVTAA
jgi:hypothetical protein